MHDTNNPVYQLALLDADGHEINPHHRVNVMGHASADSVFPRKPGDPPIRSLAVMDHNSVVRVIPLG